LRYALALELPHSTTVQYQYEIQATENAYGGFRDAGTGGCVLGVSDA